MEKKIQTHFELFVGEVGHITHNISKKREEIANLKGEEKREEEDLKSLEEELEWKRKLLEEQRKFEEYMDERK